MFLQYRIIENKDFFLHFQREQMKKFVRTQSLKYLHNCNIKETKKRVWYKHDVIIFKIKAQELLTVCLHEICLRITVFKYTQIKRYTVSV